MNSDINRTNQYYNSFLFLLARVNLCSNSFCPFFKLLVTFYHHLSVHFSHYHLMVMKILILFQTRLLGRWAIYNTHTGVIVYSCYSSRLNISYIVFAFVFSFIWFCVEGSHSILLVFNMIMCCTF